MNLYLNILYCHGDQIIADGPAIKGVSVPAVGGVARFLPSCCKFFEFYECRGTRFIGSRSPVPIHKVWLRAAERSR